MSLHIISGKVARDHVHVFVSYRPHQDLSTIVQWLKGISSRVLLQEFAHLRKKFWGRHFWARGYLAVSSGSITDEMVKEYIDSQDGEPLHDDSQFPIDSPGSHRLLGGGCSLLTRGDVPEGGGAQMPTHAARDLQLRSDSVAARLYQERLYSSGPAGAIMREIWLLVAQMPAEPAATS